MFKKILSITAALSLLATVVGCEKTPDINSSSSITESGEISGDSSQISDISESSESDNNLDPVAEGVNPLTGEGGYNAAAAGKRPVAVMVNNIKAALPQYGIAEADIIYELPVEGGITRMLAVYADYTSVPDICSVRSCRYYYPIICLGMDAIYCHWGSDKTIALETLNRTGIDHLDGEYESGLFYRDQERAQSYASEHTGYIKGDELAAKISEKGFRTDVTPEFAGEYFNFTQNGEENIPSEFTASSVTANFSDEYFSTFDYNAESGKYLKFHSGSPQMDGRTGTQLEFENVFVLQTDIHTREDGYLMDVALNSGEGYYFSNGGGQRISWIKESETSPIKIYDMSGNELSVNVGKSYIGIIGAEKTISFS